MLVFIALHNGKMMIFFAVLTVLGFGFSELWILKHGQLCTNTNNGFLNTPTRFFKPLNIVPPSRQGVMRMKEKG